MKEINQIFDKTFKKILTLSSKAVIRFVNGLFDTDYPLDSTITYNWTEFEDRELRRILADTILTINNQNSYHIEAQMTEDDTIIFRMFDYGYAHANRTRIAEENRMILPFPEPKIIYLYSEKAVPEEYILELDFGKQGTFDYHVSTMEFMRMSVEELNQKGMVILIPFELLKLRQLLKKSRSRENIVALKELLRNDIIGSINRNYDMGNISYSDAASLRKFTEILYNQIYYNQYEELEEMDAMTDESYMTDIDLIIKEQDEKWGDVVRERTEALRQLNAELEDKNAELEDKNAELEDKNAELEDKNAELADKKAKLADRDAEIADRDAKLADKDAEIADKDKEIAMLRKLLQEKS
jgi:hypothetical protein